MSLLLRPDAFRSADDKVRPVCRNVDYILILLFSDAPSDPDEAGWQRESERWVKILIILAERHLGRKTFEFCANNKRDGVEFAVKETKYDSVRETILNFCTKYVYIYITWHMLLRSTERTKFIKFQLQIFNSRCRFY